MSNKKKLLILNGSHSEIPLINAAKNMGFYVITCGNAPELIGHHYADEYHQVDYSDYVAVLDLAIRLKIDRICSCANDFGAITASYVAEKMDRPGHDSFATALLLHHKDSFKQFCMKHDIPTPKAQCFESQDEALSDVDGLTFPLIIKPVDLTGGKGVAKILTREEYTHAVPLAFQLSVQKRIVVEEFFSGAQFSFSTFIVDKKVRFYFTDNEYSYLNPYFVSTSAAPAIDADKYAAELVAAVEKMAELLKLVDGIFHIQYLANGKQAKIIDITRRCSGDLYPYPVNYAANTDWAEWIVKAETGSDCSNFPELVQSGFCGRHCIMANQNGLVKNVKISQELNEYIYDDIFWWQPDDVIDDYMTEKLGVIFLRYHSMQNMLDITARLAELIQVEMA